MMGSMIRRNLRLYFRDKAAVFFSMLGVIIIIALYLLFLGDVWALSLEGVAGVKPLMNSWIMAGVVAVTGVTAGMGALGVMVDDRAKGISRDFVVSPLRPSAVVGGYVLSTYVVSVLMSLFAYVLGEVFILLSGGALPDLAQLLEVLGVVLLNSFLCAAFVYLVVSAFRSSSAFAAASTIIGTFSGFLMGIYLPMGQLPSAIQWVVKLFPMSHAGALLRQAMMNQAMAVSFSGAPEAAVAEFEKTMGVRFVVGDWTVPLWGHVAYILAGAAVFALAALLVSVYRKKKGSL